MKIPFIVISYGDFQITKKLFSYEYNGIHTMPLFTDLVTASKFAKSMTKMLNDMDDDRQLNTQLCVDEKMALNMFETISAYCPDMTQVIINPSLPIHDDTIYNDVQLIEFIKDIKDVIEELRSSLLNTKNKSLESNSL